MINYIVYSHTSYLDILKIQTDHMIDRGHLTLFINKNDLDLKSIYKEYHRVIFYDDNDTYAKRLLSCIQKIDDPYFLLIHDIDILIDVDSEEIENFYCFLKHHNYDRIDLKHTRNTDSSKIIRIHHSDKPSEWFESEIKNYYYGDYLIKQDNPQDFIYNVNPSIWKRETLINILENFQHKTYRTIEDIDVQIFCQKFNIFKLHSSYAYACGYFECAHSLKFLHISHNGKLLPLNDSFTTVYGQSYKFFAKQYTEIVTKYNLKTSDKWIY